MKKALPVAGSLLLLIWAIWLGFPRWYSGSDLRMDDFVDQEYLVSGLERTHDFADTWKWWSGPWMGYSGQGQINSFYRPLSSLIWFCEYRAFGPNNPAGFLTFHRLSHVLVCLLALGLLRQIIGNKAALGAVCLWASGLLEKVGLPSPRDALYYWKDGPDLWISIALILMLWSLLKYWRTGKFQFLAAAVFFQLIGISLKEMAYVGPLLAAALLWIEKARFGFRLEKRHYAPLLTLLGLVISAYLFRFWALQGPGFRFGSNGSWVGRWMGSVIGGRPANLLVLGLPGDIGVALIFLGSVNLYQRHWKVGGVFLPLGSLLVLWSDWNSDGPFATLNSFLAVSSTVPLWLLPAVIDSSVAALVIGAWLSYFRHRDPRYLFGFLWLALSYLPLMTAPITAHALYLPSLGWGILLVVFLEKQIEGIPAGKANSLLFKAWFERAGLKRES